MAIDNARPHTPDSGRNPVGFTPPGSPQSNNSVGLSPPSSPDIGSPGVIPPMSPRESPDFTLIEPELNGKGEVDNDMEISLRPPSRL